MRKPNLCQHLYVGIACMVIPCRYQIMKGGDNMTADVMIMLVFLALIQGIGTMLSD